MSSNEKNLTGNLKNIKYRKLWLLSLAVICILIAGAVAAWATGSISDLTVSPDPIRIGQIAYIRFTLAQDANVSIKIFNSQGTLVKTVWDNLPKTANYYSQYWDCTDSGGLAVPDGTYRFVVEAKDTSGAVVGSGEVTANAASAPTISSVTDSPDPFNPATGEQTTITYTLSKTSLVTVTILQGATPIRTIVTNQQQPAGVNTIAWDGKDDANKLASDAPYYYQIVAANPIEPSFTTTYKSNTVTVEKEAPSFSDFTATPDPFKISVSTMTIRYTLSEAAKVTLKIVNGSGTAVKTITNNVLKPLGINSAAWNGKNDAGAYVSEGNYSVVISAVDPYNKPSGQQTLPFRAGFKPDVTNVTINPVMINPGLGEEATVNYTLTQTAKVNIEILNGYETVKTIAANEIKNAGSYSFTWNGKDSAGNALGDADYAVKITAASQAVEEFNSTYNGTITVEKGAPGIYEVSLTPEPFQIGAAGILSIRYSLSENAQVNINVYKDTTLVKHLESGTAKNVGSNTSTWDGRDDFGIAVSEGIYTVTIQAVDRFGKSDSTQANVTCGNLPVISGVTDTPDPFNPPIELNAAINFSLSAEADVTVTILKGTTPVRVISAGRLAAGVNSVNWNGKDDSAQLVPDGPYGYQIDATSPAVPTMINSFKGNTITVETKDPAVTEVTLTPTTVKIGTDATIRYWLSEPATVTMQIVDGQGQVVRDFAPVTKSSDGMYSAIWDTKNNTGALVNTGIYKVKITAVDGFSKTGSAQLQFEAGAVPHITNVSANPTTLDISTGNTTTTISYTVDQNSLVTVRLLDAEGFVWRTVIADEPANGAKTVSVNVYEDGKYPPTTALTYAIDASSAVGYFRAQQVTGTLQVLGIPNPPMDCRTCHTGFPNAHPMANCFGCHGNGEPIQDCAKCHTGNTGHADGSVLVKFKCDFCHTEKYSYKVPGHGDIGPIHNATLGTDCIKCHDPNLTVEHPKHTYDANPTQAFDCSTCHQSTVAGVVYAVNNKLKNCDACHASADHGSVHTPTGIASECTQCHVDSLTQEHLSNPKTQTLPDGTKKPWTCDTCHVSTNSTVVQAVYNKNRSCTACHSVADHNTVHTNPSFTSLPKDADMNCSLCHNAVISTEHMNRKDTAGLNYTCATCHNSTRPAVAAAISGNNLNCEACHVDTITNNPTFHTTSGSPLHDTTFVANPEVNCIQCHAGNIKTEHMGKTSSTTNLPMDCGTCHSSTDPNVITAITGKNNRCDACHAYPTVKHKSEHLSQHSAVDMTCSSCHSFALTAGTAQDISSINIHKNSCATCHGIGVRSDVRLFVASKIGLNNPVYSCEDCHGIIHLGWEAKHTGPAMATTPWNCSKCHTNMLHVEHSANAILKQNSVTNCDTCHKSTLAKVQAAINSTVTDGSNLACSACHTGTADGAPVVHSNLTAPHLTGIFPTATDTDCMNCHTTQAVEFASAKGGYHVVGSLTSKAGTAGTYVSPWTAQSYVGCKGCHGDNNDGLAQTSNILKRPYSYNSNARTANLLCYMCHTKATYGGGGYGSSGFDHNIGDHSPMQCSWCHSAVPHGTTRPHLIVTESEPNSTGNVLSTFYHPANGSYQVNSCGSNASACDEHDGY